jgi:hypothetical protein
MRLVLFRGDLKSGRSSLTRELHFFASQNEDEYQFFVAACNMRTGFKWYVVGGF